MGMIKNQTVKDVRKKLGPFEFLEDDDHLRPGNLEFRQSFVDKWGNKCMGECIKGTNIRQGRGALVGKDDYFFEGYCLNNRMEGKGRSIWPDGTYYIGQWQDGDKHGKGFLVQANGDKYEGDYFENWKHGKGTLTSADGSVYSGDW